MMKHDLTKKTLQEVSNLLQKQAITNKEAQEYCDKWNNTQGRFTIAKISLDRIVNYTLKH